MENAGPDPDRKLSLIDCDVHCVPEHASEIVDRLPAYFRTQGLVLPGGPGLPHPTGVRRVDAHQRKAAERNGGRGGQRGTSQDVSRSVHY